MGVPQHRHCKSIPIASHAPHYLASSNLTRAILKTKQSGFIFAFGCTAGIVSFNTISEILTEPPYDFSTTATGLVFFAALVGSAVGWATGALSDQLVVRLARRNGGGVKEPEMRLYALVPCAAYAALGYMLYGWGAQTGASWVAVAVGVGAMIAHQVGACAIATAYAMECFPGVSTINLRVYTFRLAG